MKWTEVETTEAYDVRHYISLKKQWEWGISKMLFGAFRIYIGLSGAHTYSVSYFCKPEDCASFWTGVVSSIMERLPEETTEQEIKALFPEQTIKPLALDHKCQEELFQLAQRLAKA